MMDHMDMVESLRAKTGLSYEEARAALERADWDMLEALVALEREGKVQSAPRYTTKDNGSSESSQTAAPEGDSFSDVLKRFGRWLGKIFHGSLENQLCMLDHSGKQLLSIPVLLFALLLLFAFWVVLPLMIVSLFFGCRYLFRGPDLGKDSINHVVGKATDAADSIKNEIRGNSAGSGK